MKKFLAMALSLAMVLSLAACGSKNETPADSTDTPLKIPTLRTTPKAPKFPW